MNKYKFKKGQKVHLDDVYEILGIIPRESYDQADPAFDDDAGEWLTFTKNVEINIKIKVS
jgi:hypothetical protein